MSTPLDQLEPGDHARSVASGIDATNQPFRLYIPTAIRAGDALPLLIVLHGRGVDHNAWFDITDITKAAEKYGYIVAAPHGRGATYYDGDGEREVLGVIDHVTGGLNIDSSRVYLTGHSTGGWGTWYVGARNARLFATLCPMAAWAPQDLLPHIGRLDPLIIHDGGDDVVPVTESRRAAATLAEHGLSFRYWERRGFGHRSAIINASLPRMFAWFADHRRDSK